MWKSKITNHLYWSYIHTQPYQMDSPDFCRQPVPPVHSHSNHWHTQSARFPGSNTPLCPLTHHPLLPGGLSHSHTHCLLNIKTGEHMYFVVGSYLCIWLRLLLHPHGSYEPLLLCGYIQPVSLQFHCNGHHPDEWMVIDHGFQYSVMDRTLVHRENG